MTVSLNPLLADPPELGVGRHCILEIYGCASELLNDAAYVDRSIREAAIAAGATLLNQVCHEFEPHGVTALALLAESHISIHTWPENGYAAVDVFTCGDHTQPEVACHHLIQAFKAEHHSLHSIVRRPPAAIREHERVPA